MPTALPSVITGARFTFSFDSKDGSAQCSSAKIAEKVSQDTGKTFGGPWVITSTDAVTITGDFLYDGNLANGGFYAALKAAKDANLAGELIITGTAGETWTADAALVTSLDTEMPADGAVKCSAEFTLPALTFAPAAAPLKVKS